MKKLLFVFLVLLIAIGLAFYVHKDSGYVMVSYHHWVISTSFWVAIATLIVAFVVLYYFVRLLKNIMGLPAWFSRRKKLKNLESYQENMTEGLSAMLVKDYSKSERFFIKASEDESSYIHYLLAAECAQMQQKIEARDRYIEKAFSVDKNAYFTIALTQAQLYMQSNQVDEAFFIFKKLYSQSPKNALILTNLKNICLKNRDYQSLSLLLPQLKKQKLISQDEVTVVESGNQST